MAKVNLKTARVLKSGNFISMEKKLENIINSGHSVF
jgi:hypothetical protein